MTIQCSGGGPSFPAGLVGWEKPLKVVSLVREIRAPQNDLKTFRFEDFC